MSADPSKTERDLETIQDPQKIQHLLKNHLSKRSLFVQGIDPPREVKIVNFTDQNVLTADLNGLDYEAGDELTLFRILGRYIQLKCAVIKHTGQASIHTLAIEEAAIARKERQFLRIPIRNKEVHISNIRTSKQSIDATLFNIPATVRVNFGLYETQLKSMGDEVKIDVFGKRGTVYDEIRREGKPLLLSNTQNPDDYEPPGSEFFDYADFLEDGLREKMHEFKRDHIKSVMIIPIIYLTHDETSLPLGYIQLRSKTIHYDKSHVEEVQAASRELVAKIRDSNTVMINAKQAVLNISRGGMRVLIDDPDLKNYLVRQNGFTFDLFFKMQAPITMFGQIRAMTTVNQDDLVLAIEFAGSSSHRKDEMKRFEKNIAAKESELRTQIEKRKAMLGQKRG